MRKLISAVFRNRGRSAYKNRVSAVARLFAVPLGNSPSAFTISHTAAYSSHSFIVDPLGEKKPLRDSMQEVRRKKKVFQC